MNKKSNIAIIGLAVMGENLALNIVNNGYHVTVYNRSIDKTEKFMKKNIHKSANLVAAKTLNELVDSLESPRKIILMVKAGNPVDEMIEALMELLSPEDIIIDGGNSYFADTQRRYTYLAKKNIRFVGMGVSGGEEGALKGPSLMPGGDRSAYDELQKILFAIAAKHEGEACVDYIGAGGAGHYVKMVHNGIEYANMQIIAEVYSYMKTVLKLEHKAMSQIFYKWNSGKLSSYLVKITATILEKTDPDTGNPLVEMILDKAEQKGTGKWTSQNALDLGVAVPTITAAVFARFISAYKEERVRASFFAKQDSVSNSFDLNKELSRLEQVLYAAQICVYAQGFDLIKSAAKEYQWQLNFSNIAKLWRNGCIIRAKILDSISSAFDANSDLENLLLNDFFHQEVYSIRKEWCQISSTSKDYYLPIPALNSALDYLDAYHQSSSNANLLQAQRDFFGAHTYERIDQQGYFHTEWESMEC